MTPQIGPNRFRTSILALLALLALGLPLNSALAQSKKKPADAPSAAAPEGWTIVLVTYAGPEHPAFANAALEQVRTLTALKDARVQPRGKGSAIVLGNFTSPADPAVRTTLQTVRATLVENRPIFAGAFLAPPRTPSELDPASAAPFALNTARAEFSPRARYSLQIAIYEAPNIADARKAAEQAAIQLRRDGEPAFYYHGPNASLVTLGAFTDADAGISKPIESPLLHELRKRHPHNLYNGNQQLLEKTPGSKSKNPQPSFLVEIPS